MAAIRRISGAFKPDPLFGVLRDQAPSSEFASVSAGAVRAVRVPIQPTVMQAFTVVGFSVQARLACFTSALNPPAGQVFARLGKLWAGVYADSPLPNTEYPFSVGIAGTSDLFPPDLSTFTPVWDGREDDIRILNANTNVAANYGLVATNYMLPAPVELSPSSQVGFGIVLTPSLFSQSLSILTVGTCSYTVLYSVETVDFGNPAPVMR